MPTIEKKTADYTVCIKPFSANNMYQGKKYKTKQYDQFKQQLIFLLPPLSIPDKVPLCLQLVARMPSQMDLDNIKKPFIDCLQIKYCFNDRHIHEIHAYKIPTKSTDDMNFCFALYAVDVT